MIRDIARAVVGESLAGRIWRRLEIIGDIAILRKPIDLELDVELYKKLAVEIMKRIPHVKSVWLAVTPVSGGHRVREYVHIAGELRSETTYREHGCLFKVDIAKVYISPTLNYEHIRVARLVNPGEEVLNMFAGAGLFSIIIARHSKPKRIISVDINPDAYRYMVENIELNKVSDTVIPVLGDAREVARSCSNCFNRVLMPLPELAYEYFEDAVISLRSAGVVHVYDFVTAESKIEAISRAQNLYLEKCESIGIRARVLKSRIVRSVGPRYYQIVLDLYLEKTS